MLKRHIIAAAVITAVFAASSVPGALAVESWRDAFVTRLMKVLSTDPTYTDIALTDFDMNGIPEAWTIKNAPDGGIGEGITMKDNTIISLNVPGNVVGLCLEDITVYSENGGFHFVGKEVGRYSAQIEYYLFSFDGQTLTAAPTEKSIYSNLTAQAYKDTWETGFISDGVPNRTKLRDFIYSYTPTVSTLSASISEADVYVDGDKIAVSGIMVNNNNYYKIRDIAMMLRSTDAKFNVEWDSSLNAVNIVTGTRYIVEGGELEKLDADADLTITENNSPIYINGSQVYLQSYNVDGNNYFRIRDLGDYLGFTIGWDEETQAVQIITE